MSTSRLAQFKEAITAVRRALAQKARDEQETSAHLLEALSGAAADITPALARTRMELESEIAGYLRVHPEITSDSPGLSDIFGLLASEEEYTRCLGWLLSPANTGAFGRRLLGAVIEHTHGWDQGAQDYDVLCEHGIEAGQLDILVQSRESKGFMVVIENKILPGTSEGVEVVQGDDGEEIRTQLAKYQRWAKRQEFGNLFLVFLCQDPHQMKSTRTDFGQIGWRDLLVAAQRLRSQADGLSVLAETVLDLFLRDVERFTSPLKAYRGVLRQVENAAGADEDAGVSLRVLQRITDIICEKEDWHVAAE